MGIFESATLFIIMALLSAIPSTSVALVIARSITLNVANGFAVSAGIVLGDLVFIFLAILGLTLIAELMGTLFVLIKILGAIYLLWFGSFLLLSKSVIPKVAENRVKKSSLVASFMAGFFLTLGDVKAIIFYASLFPLFINIPTIEISDIMAVVFITIFSVGGVKVIYAILANKAAIYAQKTNLENRVKKIVGSLMIGVGGYLIIKS